MLMVPPLMVTSASVTVMGMDKGVASGMRRRVTCTFPDAVSQGTELKPLTGIVVVPVWSLLLPIRMLAWGALRSASATTATGLVPLVAFKRFPVGLAYARA